MGLAGWKRSLAGAMVVGLSFGLQPLSLVQAQAQTLELQVATPGYKADAALPYKWDDAWFSDVRDAYQYNHEMARVAGALMSTVYLQSQYHELTQLFASLGCSMDTLEDHHYAAREPQAPDKSGYTFCTKMITVDGKQLPLVFVVIRGTAGQQEWLSNANIANTTQERQQYHEGFANSAWGIGADLKAYMEAHGLRNPATRILVTGHSRGAAVANLLGSFLDSGHYVRDEQASELVPAHVYVYTFATPNSCADAAMRTAKRFRNIFNIVNPEDVVPELPFRSGSWDYGSFGTTYYLPTANNLRGDTARYEHLLKKMQVPFSKLTQGRTYTPLPGSEWLARDMKGMQWMVGSVNAFYRKNVLLSHEQFAAAMRGLPQDEDERADAYYDGAMKLMAKWFPKEKAGFEDMHSPATYNAWILSGEPKDIYMRGTPSAVSIRLEKTVAESAARKHRVGEILGKAPQFPFDLEVRVPGGETVLRLKDGKLDPTCQTHGYELKLQNGNEAIFTVPEGEKVEAVVTAQKEMKLEAVVRLEANKENGESAAAAPVGETKLSLQKDKAQVITIDENRQLALSDGK